MSREALSLEISRLVSRVVSGEEIDTAEKGVALAAKYPGVGMSGEMIGQAIDRAAGMVGMIRSAPTPPKPPRGLSMTPIAEVRIAEDGQIDKRESVSNRPANSYPAEKAATVVLPVATQSIDDELAAAIDAEIGNLVIGHAAAQGANSGTNGGAYASNLAPHASAAPRTEAKGPVAAFRRALFGV